MSDAADKPPPATTTELQDRIFALLDQGELTLMIAVESLPRVQLAKQRLQQREVQWHRGHARR